MTIYVDNAHIRARVRSGPIIHDSTWCHLYGDTTEELVTFAVALGLQAKHLQHPGTWKEHFDVTAPKRALAVTRGAVEVDYREWAMKLAKKRFEEG